VCASCVCVGGGGLWGGVVGACQLRAGLAAGAAVGHVGDRVFKADVNAPQPPTKTCLTHCMLAACSCQPAMLCLRAMLCWAQGAAHPKQSLTAAAVSNARPV
jgi:hypothetical protein